MKVYVMITMGLTMVFIGSCKKDKVDKSILVAEVTRAQNLVKTSQDVVALEAAITAAQLVVKDGASTKATVSIATARLFEVVTMYQNQIVLPINHANLVGHWTFNEIKQSLPGNPVKDYSGNSHDGTIKVGHAFWGAGTPSLTEDRYGIAGKALHFDSGGNIEIPYSIELNPPIMSITVWAKPEVNSPVINNQYIISMNHWNGYKLNFQDTPRAFFTVTYDDRLATPAILKHCCYDRDQNNGIAPQGAWHHYVITFGGGHEIFYIDGIMINDWNDTPGTISQLQTPVNLMFGQDLPTNLYATGPSSDPNYLINFGGFYIGALDEVRIYKCVLTQAQVTSIYNLEKP
jgi:hypothetical protein